MRRPKRCRALARAAAVLALTVPPLLTLAGSATAGAPTDRVAKKPSPAASSSPAASPSATTAMTRATPSSSPSLSPAPSPPTTAHGHKHATASPTAASPTATATRTAANPSAAATTTAAPAPAASVAPAHGNKHRISPSPATTSAQPSPSATTAAPAPIGPTIPAFIGPVASRSVHPPAPVAFIGPIAPRHISHPHPHPHRVVAPHSIRRAAVAVRPSLRPAAVGVLPGTDVLPAVHSIVRSSVDHPQAPLAFALLVLLFLLVQHRIDRRDPKLAVTPRGDREELEFGTTIRYA